MLASIGDMGQFGLWDVDEPEREIALFSARADLSIGLWLEGERMWQSMSLRMRLNALFGSFLLLGLAFSMVFVVAGASPRVKAEDESTVRLAREFVYASLASLKQVQNPDEALSHLMEGFQNLRHVSVIMERSSQPGQPVRQGPAPDRLRPTSVPHWFATLVSPIRTIIAVPIEIEGVHYGSILIASNPWDEVAEVWESFLFLALGGSALVLFVLLLNSWIVGRALSPIASLGHALEQLSNGAYDERIMPSGAPELHMICTRLNLLSDQLQKTMQDNYILTERLISLQDDERKELARELHDEFGPYLFAIRVGLNVLRRGEPASQSQASIAEDMQKQIDTLQQINRRVLERLRPMGLSELGLMESLRSLIGLWRATHPQIEVYLNASAMIDGLDERLALTIYRLVQESLTNVFRHADASRVDVSLYPAQDQQANRILQLEVRDNGIGLADTVREGFGLIGMRERVQALRGKLKITTGAAQGTLIVAELPMA